MAYTHQVGQAVAAHVRQEDRLVLVAEHQRGTVQLVVRLEHLLGGRPALALLGRIPAEHLIFGHQQIGDAVAREIDPADIWTLGVFRRHRAERSEGLPGAVFTARLEARHGPVQVNEIHPAVAVDVHQSRTGQRQRRLLWELVQRTQPRVSVVALVVPAAVDLGEQARQSFAVEIHPLHASGVHTPGQVRQPDERAEGVSERGLGVLQQQRGQRVRGPRAVVLPHPAALGHACQRGDHFRRVVLQVRGPHHGPVPLGQLVEAVQHQHAPAQAVAAPLEPTAPRRERVFTRWPGGALGVRRIVLAVLAVVEQHHERPVVVRGGLGDLVAVPHALGKMVRGLVACTHAGGLEHDARGSDAVQVRLVLVADEVAALVTGFLDQPLEHVLWIARVGHSRVVAQAVHARDVVAGHRAPVGTAVATPRPPLDACESTLDARPVAAAIVPLAVHESVRHLGFVSTGVAPGHQVLDAR